MRTLTSDPTAHAADADAATWAERNHHVTSLGVAWVRALLGRATSQAEAARAHGREPAAADDSTAIAARREYEEARAALSHRHEAAAIDRLSMLFGLAPFDEDVLLLAVAPRLDPSIRALYARAHDGGRPASATAHLATALLAADPAARAAAHVRFGPGAPLRRCGLIAVEDDNAGAAAPLETDERVTAYLLGQPEIDVRVRPHMRGVTAGPCPARHTAAVSALVAELAGSGRPAALILGPPASGQRAVAADAASRIGLGLVELDLGALPPEPIARRARLTLIARESRLSGFAVLLDLTAQHRAWSDEGGRPVRAAAEDALASLETVVLVAANEYASPDPALAVIRLEALEPGDRAAIWRAALGGDAAAARADDLAEQFVLDPGDIAAIAARASKTDGTTLWTACREAAARSLDGLVERVVPRFGWDDLVVPPAVLGDLRALVAQVRYRATVYREWGFAARLPRGRGVSALLAGPTGVGKTLAAEVIANDLGLDLYKVDLSGVVSKYIGETEKNLRRVFDAAEAGGAVLFFDEADALFGKRSEVKDSHDRYANIEVSYLLQRMEAYSGLAMLATNLKSHLDAAFLRRLRYVIDIPFPDASSRRAIWARAFPPGAPTDALDFTALARLDIAGGSIVVIAVNAAFLAAADGVPIGMRHVARAARSEFRKLDKEFRAPWPDTTP